MVRVDPSRTGGQGGEVVEHLRSSVAVRFNLGLGSLHRSGLVVIHFGVEREHEGLRART